MAEQPLIWASIRGLTRLLAGLSQERASRLGGRLGRLVGLIESDRRARSEARVVRALRVDGPKARRIVRGAYDHFGRCAAEFLRLPLVAPEMGRYVSVEGEEYLRSALDRGRGVVLLSGHLGNWEYGVALLALKGYPVQAIGAEQRDPRITDLVGELRASAGVRPLGKGFDLKAAISCLRGGEVLAILLDQDAKSRGLISPFLGLPASTPVGPVKLAAKTGAAVVPCFCLREPDGVSFRLRIHPPLDEAGGRPFGEDPQASVDRCNRVIGEAILSRPAQWMWMYPRWASTLGDRK
jgi:KDO2-lipid IV(A) lauroyltransferase